MQHTARSGSRHLGAVLATLLTAAVLAAVPAVPATGALPGANGPIAFERGADIWLVEPDGTDLRNLTQTADVQEQDPVISPDGTQVAFRVEDFGGQIWVQGIDGSGRQQLTDSPSGSILGNAERPTWSPDGTHIAFSGFHRTEGQNVLWLVEVATGDHGPLTTGYVAEKPDWGSHGEIVFTAPPGRFMAIDPATGAERVLLRADDAPDRYRSIDHPEWHPDGTHVLFSCDDQDICEVRADGSGWRYLTEKDESVATALRPQYSPDGQQVAYYGTSPETHGGSDFDIWRMPAGGVEAGDRVAVTSGPATDRYPDWGPTATGAPPGGGTPPPAPPAPPPPPPAPPEPPAGPTLFDGDAATTAVVERGEPVAAAIDISRARFAGGGFAQGGPRADWVVLSRDDDFPDSLAGSALTSVGPMLFTDSRVLTPATREEIARVLAPQGRVYLLGGVNAISADVEAALRADGYTVVRLQGDSRVETAIAVADEVRSRLDGDGRVMLARAGGPPDNPTAGWADSVTGGGIAARDAIPILVTQTEGMHPAVAAWLSRAQPTQTILLGGELALGPAVQGAAPNAVRAAGDDRTATAAAIASQVWPSLPVRRHVVINGWHPQGWAFGLAAAGLSADADAPLAVVGEQISPSTAAMVGSCGDPEVELVLVGDDTVIPPAIAAELDRLDGEACDGGPDGGGGGGGTTPPPGGDPAPGDPPPGGTTGSTGRWEVQPTTGIYELSFDFDGAVLSDIRGWVAEYCTGASGSNSTVFVVEDDVPVSGGAWSHDIEYPYGDSHTVRERFEGRFTSATTAEGELHYSFTGLGSTCTTHTVTWTAVRS